MKTPSKYLERKFQKYFSRGCEFWTSEDGSLQSLVIANREDWAEVLQFEFAHRLNGQFDPTKGKHLWTEQEWAGSDYFDGNSGTRAGKVWRLTDEPTPFSVIEYPLA